MAKKQGSRPIRQSKPSRNSADGHVEEKLVAFAGQLGWLVGTVQSKAEGWLDRKALVEELGRIRDGANDLLAHVTPGLVSRRKSTAPQPDQAVARVSRGPVDAPRKRHRQPPSQLPMDKRLGAPKGKQMGQKSAKRGTRRGRG